jgi:hypothetical protein
MEKATPPSAAFLESDRIYSAFWPSEVIPNIEVSHSKDESADPSNDSSTPQPSKTFSDSGDIQLHWKSYVAIE